MTMKFAGRTSWDLSSNSLTQEIEALKSCGKKVLDLTVSNPTLCRFSYPKEIFEQLADPESAVYEADPRGLKIARQAVCDYYASRSISLDINQVWLTASTSEAYTLLFRLLMDPNDMVAFPRPSYPLFDFLAEINDLKAVQYSLFYDKGWRLDKDSFIKALENPDLKAVVMVNPNNPTGSCLSAEEIEFVIDQLRRKHITLICDEVFLDYAFDKNTSLTSMASVDNEDFFLCVLNGLSKVCILPQMKLSWMVLKGAKNVIDEANRRLEVIADTYLSVNIPVQLALPSWLAGVSKLQDQVKARICKNRDALKTAIKDACGIDIFDADGGWNAVVPLAHKTDEETFVLSCLKDQGLIVYPGYFFDFDEPCCVVSLLAPEDIFFEGIQCLARQINKGEDAL